MEDTNTTGTMTPIVITTGSQPTKNKLLYIIVAIIFAVGIFIGVMVGPTPEREGYKYVPTELVDSLEQVSSERLIRIDTLDSLLLLERLDLDGTDFVTDKEFDGIVKDKADELYNKIPSDIDSLFINEYDSAVAARRFKYN